MVALFVITDFILKIIIVLKELTHLPHSFILKIKVVEVMIVVVALEVVALVVVALAVEVEHHPHQEVEMIVDQGLEQEDQDKC